MIKVMPNVLNFGLLVGEQFGISSYFSPEEILHEIGLINLKLPIVDTEDGETGLYTGVLVFTLPSGEDISLLLGFQVRRNKNGELYFSDMVTNEFTNATLMRVCEKDKVTRISMRHYIIKTDDKEKPFTLYTNYGNYIDKFSDEDTTLNEMLIQEAEYRIANDSFYDLF